MKSAQEKAASKAKKEAKKSRKPDEKRQRGRPKGSKNKVKSDTVELNPELLRIQAGLRRLLKTVGMALSLKYVVLDGHFGNYPSAFMVKGENLDLISKMRSDAALYETVKEMPNQPGRPRKYGNKLDMSKLDEQDLKSTASEDNLQTDIYRYFLQQGICFCPEYGHYFENESADQCPGACYLVQHRPETGL